MAVDKHVVCTAGRALPYVACLWDAIVVISAPAVSMLMCSLYALWSFDFGLLFYDSSHAYVLLSHNQYYFNLSDMAASL